MLRSEAAAFARSLYQYASSVVFLKFPDRREYHQHLAARWEARLARGIPQDAELTGDELLGLLALCQALLTPRDDEAQEVWQDAFPDAVCDLLLGSESDA